MEHIPFYRYSELSEEAKQEAYSKHCDINVEHDQWWYDEGLLERYKNAGLKVEIKDLEFDLYHRECHWNDITVDDCRLLCTTAIGKPMMLIIDMDKKAQTIADQETMEWYGTFTGHGCNRGKTPLPQIMGEVNDYLWQKYQVDINDKIESLIDDLDKETLRDLDNQYEYLTSQESVGETLEANEYLFNKNGTVML